MSTTTEIKAPASAAEYAQMLIDDITVNGHYRGLGNTPAELLSKEVSPACLVSNHISPCSNIVLRRFRDAIAREAGIDYYGLVEWNDSTSTEEVLEVLRKIAEGTDG